MVHVVAREGACLQVVFFNTNMITTIPYVGSIGADPVGLMNRLKSFQGQVPNRGTPKKREVPVKSQPNMNLGGLLGGLLASVNGGKPERTPCVWISNLPEEYVDADVLCNIFGNFGNVQNVKFIEKKPDGASIELDDPRSAMRAVRFLDKKKMKVYRRKRLWKRMWYVWKSNVVHKTGTTDDKKLQSSLKKISVSQIPRIEEVCQNEDNDGVPDLVGNFEEACQNEVDGQMMQTLKISWAQ